MSWYSQLESTIFTRLKHDLGDKIPGINYTTVNENAEPNEFPTLYLHELPAKEVGQDLDNVSVNALLYTVEIQIWTNTKEKDCKNIADEAIDIMKSMRFNVVAFPDVQTSNNVQFAVIRFRRVIGDGDVL